MLGLLLVAAGLLLICGAAKNIAGEIVKGVLAVVLVLSLLPCLIRSCATIGLPGSARASSLGLVSLLLLALGLFGFTAWRRRAERAKRRELWAKRSGSPRSRALPSPPANDQDNGSSLVG